MSGRFFRKIVIVTTSPNWVDKFESTIPSVPLRFWGQRLLSPTLLMASESIDIKVGGPQASVAMIAAPAAVDQTRRPNQCTSPLPALGGRACPDRPDQGEDLLQQDLGQSDDLILDAGYRI